MATLSLLLLLLCCCCSLKAELATSAEQTTTPHTREGRDSYLDALQASHNGGVELVKPVRLANHRPAPLYTAPEKQFNVYATPEKLDTMYGVPDTKYGVPEKLGSKYGPPDAKYGAPEKQGTKYGDGNHDMMPWYSVPHVHHHYQVPEPAPQEVLPEENGYGGFDLKTVFKFIAKIVVLKVIVKLVYLVMYLLFVPKLGVLQVLGGGGEKEKPDSVESQESEGEEQGEQEEEQDELLGLFRSDKFGYFRSDMLERASEAVARALEGPPQ